MSAPVTVHGRAWIGDEPLFAPVELELAEGGWTCLLGPSGVGKSTLLRLIAGLETGARFDGEVLRDRPVALMAQDSGLIPWLDVVGNVTLGARLRGELGTLARNAHAAARRDAPVEGPAQRGASPRSAATARALALIESVGLTDRADYLPANLSGGQRQRVALARTLFEDRPVVLLDEPFSALDARTRVQMQDLSARLLADRTVLLVTHDPAEAARLGDRILLLRQDGLTECPVGVPRPLAAARPFDAPEVLDLQSQLMRGMMA